MSPEARNRRRGCEQDVHVERRGMASTHAVALVEATASAPGGWSSPPGQLPQQERCGVDRAVRERVVDRATARSWRRRRGTRPASAPCATCGSTTRWRAAGDPVCEPEPVERGRSSATTIASSELPALAETGAHVAAERPKPRSGRGRASCAWWRTEPVPTRWSASGVERAEPTSASGRTWGSTPPPAPGVGSGRGKILGRVHRDVGATVEDRACTSFTNTPGPPIECSGGLVAVTGRLTSTNSTSIAEQRSDAFGLPAGERAGAGSRPASPGVERALATVGRSGERTARRGRRRRVAAGRRPAGPFTRTVGSCRSLFTSAAGDRVDRGHAGRRRASRAVAASDRARSAGSALTRGSEAGDERRPRGGPALGPGGGRSPRPRGSRGPCRPRARRRCAERCAGGLQVVEVEQHDVEDVADAGVDVVGSATSTTSSCRPSRHAITSSTSGRSTSTSDDAVDVQHDVGLERACRRSR